MGARSDILRKTLAHQRGSAFQPGALLHGPRLAVHSVAACVGQAAAVRWAHTAAPLPRRDGQGYRLVVLWRSACRTEQNNNASLLCIHLIVICGQIMHGIGGGACASCSKMSKMGLFSASRGPANGK